MEQLPKHALFLTGTYVSHVNGWILLSNGNVQYKYLFPRLTGHSQTGSEAG
jgi:hypothetical protein